MRFLQYENRICGECGKFCKVLEIGYRNAKRKEVGGRQRLAQICDISCNQLAHYGRKKRK